MMTLEEENKEISEKWGNLGNDEQLPSTPQLTEAIKKDAFKNQYLKKIHDFKESIKGTLDYYYNKKKEFLIFKDEFANGRYPKTYNKFLYGIFLSILIILEIPTNYSTIEQLLHKPAISAFITIAVGMLLVFIAHFHGKFLKQLKFILKIPSTETRITVPSKAMDIGIFLASLIVLGVIFFALFYIRKQYYIDMLGGDDMEDINIMTKVGVLMLANMVIYLLGAISSYIIHDFIPNYQETYFNMKKHSDEIQKKYKKLKKELDEISSFPANKLV